MDEQPRCARARASGRAGAVLLLLALALPAATAGARPPAVKPHELHATHAGGALYMGARLLGALAVTPGRVDGVPVADLSGLAWDEDAGLLYALSDNGYLFHLRVRLEGERLAGVEFVAGFALRDAGGAPLRGARADAEGLAIANARNGDPADARLVVSFERRPRVDAYRTDGSFVAALRVPWRLTRAWHYASSNRGLESVTRHPVLGWLTAPERPLRDDTLGSVPIYALGDSRRWLHPLGPGADTSVVALEALPDGSLLVLERNFEVLGLHMVTRLRHAEAPVPDAAGGLLRVRDLVTLDSAEGWHIDNFEGLARHRGARFFLVSDDNDSAFQRTILAYLELVAPGLAAPGAGARFPNFELRHVEAARPALD